MYLAHSQADGVLFLFQEWLYRLPYVRSCQSDHHLRLLCRQHHHLRVGRPGRLWAAPAC
jgi:hypothetical protein